MFQLLGSRRIDRSSVPPQSSADRNRFLRGSGPRVASFAVLVRSALSHLLPLEEVNGSRGGSCSREQQQRRASECRVAHPLDAGLDRSCGRDRRALRRSRAHAAKSERILTDPQSDHRVSIYEDSDRSQP